LSSNVKRLDNIILDLNNVLGKKGND